MQPETPRGQIWLLIDMRTRLENDGAGFRIPLRAWLVVGLGIAAALVAMASGTAVQGSICKGCRLTFYAPFWWAAASLCVGSALSIWIGALPRTSVAPWAGVVAAAFTGVSLLIVVVGPTPWSGVAGLSVFIAMVFLPTLWLLQLPLGLLAASVPSPFRPRSPAVDLVRDNRPHWQREISASLAALCDDRGALRGGDLQQITELAFALSNDNEAPPLVHQHAANLRSLLSRAMKGAALRAAVIAELEAALVAEGGANPYR